MVYIETVGMLKTLEDTYKQSIEKHDPEDTSCDVMVSKLDLQTIVCEFDSHWASHTSVLVLYLSKAIK